MIDQHLRKSNVVEVVSVDQDEGTGAVKIVVRALNEKPWIRMMSDLLRATHGLESFGLEVHKVFYAQDATSGGPEVRFAWMIMCWGELDQELEARLAPILSKSLPVAPASSFASTRRPQEARRAKPQRAAPTPAPETDDDDGPPEPTLVARQRLAGQHRVRFERHVEAGDESYDVYSIPLPHVRGPMYEGKKSSEVINMNSGRGRFKATVRGRGEDEFTPSKEGL